MTYCDRSARAMTYCDRSAMLALTLIRSTPWGAPGRSDFRLEGSDLWVPLHTKSSNCRLIAIGNTEISPRTENVEKYSDA
jgi:hypothetical protein